jgi:hypothetical protein
MNPAHGVWYGIAFDMALFGGWFLIAWTLEQRRRRRWAESHPPVPGSGRRTLARMRRLVQPTLLLIPAEEPGFSKLGGDPEMPPSLDWPAGSREPRTFLAQIDLGAFRPHAGPEWLPEQGRFYAFYDPDGHGRADVVRVLYSLEEPGPERSSPTGVARHRERRVAFLICNSAPNTEWLNIREPLDMDFEELEALRRAIVDTPPADELQHRIGGYPDEIQDECMPISCERLARGLEPLKPGEEEQSVAILRASKQWRMLMQVDSDPDLKMEFGDAGRLYVFIRDRDAREADFSKTVTLSQSY